MAHRVVYSKIMHKIGPKTKFAFSMTGIASTLLAIDYYQRRNHKINLVVGLDGPLVSIRPSKVYNNKNYEYDPLIGRSRVPNPAFNITSRNQKYNVWVRPYASIMFFMLQPFCNFYMYTSMEKDIAKQVLHNVKWSDRFIEKRYGHGISRKIYDENNCGNVILLITDSSELFQNQNNIAYPYEFRTIPRFDENDLYDSELIRFTGRIIYRFFT